MEDKENVAKLMMFLPKGYEEECYKQGALTRKRGITSAADLMLLSIFHLHNGCSLMEISEIGRLAKICDISDVAFMKRFEKCGEWFKAINAKMATDGIISYEKPAWLKDKTVISIDASDVTEKGRSGRIYRLHYALDIFQMTGVQHKITTNEVGESLCNFEFHSGQLVIADRGYSRFKDIAHCEACGAEYLIRMRMKSFTIRDDQGEVIDLSASLARLRDDECLDLRGYVNGQDGGKIPIRICARRKTPEAIEETQKKLRRKEQRKQAAISDEAKEFNEYIIVITNLNDTVSANNVLETYRLRWQIEIYFKRLKSIMDFGELPKRKETSVFAWLNGKIMVALLLEKLIASISFPPQEFDEEKHLA